MTEETYKAQAAFAGEKKPSMLRRRVGHDYTGRQMYMITMVTEGRRPLLGQVVGRSDAPKGSPDEPAVRLTPLGIEVEREWWACSAHHPEIAVVALQLMPDHLHGVLFVKEQMEKPLGMALRGFKQACNRHYRELILGQQPSPASPSPSSASPSSSVALSTQHTATAVSPASPSPSPASLSSSVALSTQHTATAAPQKRDRRGEDRSHGLLFARGYNDRILFTGGRLERWLNYLEDNPRRLLMKRERPDLFRVQRNVQVGGLSFSALGNLFLLDRPCLLQVQCSRRLTDTEIQQTTESFMNACQRGAVLVSPAISPGEKAVMRAAFEHGYPVVVLLENGLTDLAKPGGKRMDACMEGRLLLLAPWAHHNERITISRSQCLSLNEMAHAICAR